MIAIAHAESGCREDAVNVSFPERSVGILQLDVTSHLWINDWCARDTACSARAALRIYESQGLRAWTTYRNGSYRRWMPR